MMNEDKNIRKFLNKKSLLERRLKNEVLEDGIAYIPCHVESMEDIISRYSIRGCESLNAEFADYIMSFIECIPIKYPIVLEIYGPKFTDEEKKTIVNTIVSDGDYQLGRTIQDNRHHRMVFIEMVIGTIIMGLIITFIGQYVEGIPRELFYVLFYLFADSFVRYIFIERGDYKNEKISAGRIASMKVEFVEREGNGI